MCLVGMLLLPILAGVLVSPTQTVLPLGDSITYGCGDNCTSSCSAALPCVDCLQNGSYTPCAPCSSGYRLPLYRMLLEPTAGASHSRQLEFVGPLSTGPPAAPAAAKKHGGWPGIRISGQ